MTTSFDFNLHVFHSPQFQSVVDEAVGFFTATPVHRIPPPSRFIGAGVYGLYYAGDFELYTKIAEPNRQTCIQPIYVGKAVPSGWRMARITDSETPVLYQRLREHMRSIQQATNLQIDDFRCRFMILGGIESERVATTRRNRNGMSCILADCGRSD